MLYSAMYCAASDGRLRDREVDVGGNALGEALGEPRLGPLAPRPRLALGSRCVERREREVEQHHERELVVEEVVDDVRRRVVAGERSRRTDRSARGRGRTACGSRGRSRACGRRATRARTACARRARRASSASPAKFVRTNSSNAAASPSSARQKSATCFNPRWSRGCAASPYFATSSFSSLAARILHPGRRPRRVFPVSCAMTTDIAAKRITVNTNIFYWLAHRTSPCT